MQSTELNCDVVNSIAKFRANTFIITGLCVTQKLDCSAGMIQPARWRWTSIVLYIIPGNVTFPAS